ncbi:hypothetical protein J7E95_37490 [Streptomyces sp. ISL-14]|nr:hypothetical protein [Streptomyces sp. ISL-14]
MREAEAGEAYELLAVGEVDLALSLAAQAPTVGDVRLTRVPLLADPLDVALPRGHRLAGGEAVRPADLKGRTGSSAGVGRGRTSRGGGVALNPHRVPLVLGSS